MADYYPLIARAIAGLDPSAPGESRRALYERARAALIAQLRSVQPPLSESEITRERLSLEEAVRKVESEAAQRARDASRPGGGRRARRAGDAFRRHQSAPAPAGRSLAAGSRTAAARPPAAGAAPQRRPPPLAQTTVRTTGADRPRQTSVPQRNLRADPPQPRPQPPDRRIRRCRRPASASGAPRRGSDNAAAADAAAAARRARLPRHRRRCRRSRPRRRAGQPRRAENLRQRAVALAGIRPARAEHGKPRRRSGRALFL